MDTKDNRHSQHTGETFASAFGMNRSMDSDAQEDLPPMRAVSLRNQPADLQYSKKSRTKGDQFFGKKDDFDKFNKILKSRGRSASGTGVRRDWNKCSWKVSILNEVPLDFPLESTRREICEVHVTEVVDRITNSLRLLSIDAEFDDENAKAKCKTSDFVNFRIRLFAGESRAQKTIIVEIQRRSGPPWSFMSFCKKILDVAEGLDIYPERVPARQEIPPCILKTPVHELKCLRNIDNRDPHKDIDIAMNKSLEMMRSKRKDVNALGLENLCFMTDPLKTRPDMAIICCKAIILGKYCTEFREQVGVMLQKDAILPEEFGTHPYKELSDKCRHLAIVLLLNILALTFQDGCLDDAVQNQNWFTEFLIPSLLDEVRSFEVSSNNAYEAACGLTYLATCSDAARGVMKENFAVDDLQSANYFARYKHDLLASETARSLRMLGHPI